MPTITPCLWFDTQAEEAAAFYTSVFPNSRITNVGHYTEAGPREAGSPLIVDFELDGQRMLALNGGPQFTFDEAISLFVDCASQEEVDHYWERLTADGGSEVQRGWLRDRFGLSWQIAPSRAMELITDPDPAVAARATQALQAMRKIDIAALEAATWPPA